MANEIDFLDFIQTEFDNKLNQRRSVLLDLFEELLGHSEHWELFRKKLLKFCGDSGIRGDLISILEELKKTTSSDSLKV